MPSFRTGLTHAPLPRRAALAGTLALAAGARRARAAGPVLRLGDQKGGVEALLRASGELESLPYRLEIAQFPAAAPLLEALNAGAVDVAWAGDAPTTFALAHGTPAHIVSAHRSNGAGTALLVKPDSPVRDVADLPGRRIGTSRGSIGQALVIAALRARHLPADAVTFAWLLPADANAALEEGDIDVWASWGVFVAQAVLANHDRIIVDGSHGLLSGLGYLSALDEAIVAKRALLHDLIGRAARAARWANAHVDAYSRYWAGLVGVSVEVARLSFTTAPALAVPIDAGVVADQQRTADLYSGAGLIAHGDVRGYFDTSFNDAVAA
jgi:sulfonate transport system substrate-binding protein